MVAGNTYKNVQKREKTLKLKQVTVIFHINDPIGDMQSRLEKNADGHFYKGVILVKARPVQ